jgi:hypothetical protein
VDSDQARHYRPSAAKPVLIGHLIDAGESLAASFNSLAKDPSPERADLLLAKLRGAEQGVEQFRRALAREGES